MTDSARLPCRAPARRLTGSSGAPPASCGSTALGRRRGLDEVTVGLGQVIPSSKIQVVQNLEGGIVAEILVEPGPGRAQGPATDADRRHAILVFISRRRREGRRAARAHSPTRGRGGARALQASRGSRAGQAGTGAAGAGAVRLAATRFRGEPRRAAAAGGAATQELAEMEARAAQLQESYELVQQELAMIRPGRGKGRRAEGGPGAARAAGERPEAASSKSRASACRVCSPP